jgi:acyl CoA:acetate/3-ketoacid CoA transferase beta subunit
MNHLSPLHQSLQTMADGFRRGNHVALGTELPDVLAQIVVQTVNVANTSPDIVHQLIKKCLHSFEHGDWLGLADLLEYEVAALPIE